MSIETHWDHYRELRQAGLESLKRGEMSRAREELLRAAHDLMRVASLSRGEQKKIRFERARALCEFAKQLELNRDAGSAESELRLLPDARPDVDFDQIAGLEEAKQELRLRAILPLRYRQQAERYRVRTRGGVLLYGPPGTGKTLLARATAGETQSAFFNVRPSDILSKWVGDSEQHVAELFESARQAAPSIIFLDEIDALAPARSDDQPGIMNRLVPQLLAELDGFKRMDEAVLFVGATNRPWSLDPAMLRPGRFDRLIYVGLPDLEARLFMFGHELEGRPTVSDLNIFEAAQLTEGYSGADIQQICSQVADRAFLRSIEENQAFAIDRSLLLEVIQTTQPSVPARELRKYESYR